MASLLARHQTTCEAFPRKESSFDKATPANGCTCKPTYVVVLRSGPGGRVKVGKKRDDAKRALRKFEAEADAGAEFTKPVDTTWPELVSLWRSSLACTENTKRSYDATVDYADAVFGNRRVRSLTTADVLALLAKVREPKRNAVGSGDQQKTVEVAPSPSTVAKHLRVLKSILSFAVAAGYLASNPAGRIPKQQRPKREGARIRVRLLHRHGVVASVRRW